MLYMKEWSENLDLTEFYLTCAEKGYTNNCSEKRMLGSIRKEKEWNCWILYSDQTAIGSVAAHSFDDVMGPNTYRILSRTCAFNEYSPYKGFGTKRRVFEHQHFTDQFFVPRCLEWAGDSRTFITSISSANTSIKSQRLVHDYYLPLLEGLGLVTRMDNIFYRGVEQTVWEAHKNNFLDRLNQYPRW